MTPKQQYYERAAAGVIERLARRQMGGHYCADGASARDKALELIGRGSTVGFGGSQTIRQIGLLEALRGGDYLLIDREQAKGEQAQRELHARMMLADSYVMSSNAITLDGELVNIDARGNRVAMLCYGPRQVIVVAGMNKLCPDLDSAVLRARNLAAPPNALRLSRETPCVRTGRCGDCYSADSICSQIVITRRSGEKGRIQVILVGEELGY